MLERGHQYDGRHEFSTWLYAVARNLTIDYLRKKSPVSLDGLMDDEEHAPLEPADTGPWRGKWWRSTSRPSASVRR